MRWIKANERLPNANGFYCIKWAEHYFKGKRVAGVYSGFLIEERGIVPNNDVIEWLDESLPVSAEEEAAKMYPFVGDKEDLKMVYGYNQVKGYMRDAHIRCAGMYTGEIASLKAELSRVWMNYIVTLYRQQGVTEETIEVNWNEYKAKHNL